ncbi:MAG: cob(I)yrinic acid a,c-diamide adenosyltransferase [Patescibacteria group bacterium]
MLYTRKGDQGTTKTFGCDQRISKSSNIAETLGTLDETNSYLGICKSKSKESGFGVEKLGLSFDEIVHTIQKNLFIIQAEFAGADKTISEEKVKEVEKIIDEIEKELPPIKTFFIAGATELGAHFDFARTLARRAERRAVGVKEANPPSADAQREDSIKIGDETMKYLNRLSSLLYALARLSNHKSGINEDVPDYK